MAGGKETPRQKMIGMMYLVLTALLALNVSKQILDAFIAIELNISNGAITQKEKDKILSIEHKKYIEVDKKIIKKYMNRSVKLEKLIKEFKI